MGFFSYFYIGTNAEDKDYEYREVLVNIMLVVSMIALSIFTMIHMMHGDKMIAFFQASLSGLYAFAYFAHFKFISKKFKEILVISGTILMFLFLFANGGIAKTGIYWVPFFPFLLFAVAGLRKGWRWLAVFISGLVIVQLLDYGKVLSTPYSYEETMYFFIAFIFYVFIAALFEGLRIEQQQLLEHKNDNLLDVRERLSEALSNLEKEIKTRTFELQESNQQLANEIKDHKTTNQDLRETEQKFFQAQKMEALGTLVGGIAHDFSNVMSGISANLFLIQREIKGNMLVQNKLDDVEKLVFHASNMSKQLLTFARKDKVEKKQFNMSSFINEAVKLSAVSLSSRIKLEKDLTDTPLPFLGSATQLQQVLMNLFNNARDALSKVDEPMITVVVKRLDEAGSWREKHPDLAGEWLYLSVRDNGEGVSQNNLLHIFEPFFTTKELGKGTGLGLAMCYGAIKSHGGLIEVESQLGLGCTFHVYLPLEVSKKSRQALGNLNPNLAGKGETILIVDDDKALRIAHHSVLEKLNYHVLQAEDGLEAIKVYAKEQENIDLVIMDSMMPNMSGIKAAQHILMMNKDVKIFFATGYEEDSTTERWLSNGDVSLDSITRLKKPFTIEQLCHKIRETLS